MATGATTGTNPDGAFSSAPLSPAGPAASPEASTPLEPPALQVLDLPDKAQDYLKVIWDICEKGAGAASLGEIAAQTGQKLPTASEAIKRLLKQGLVEHEPYSGVSLSPRGEKLAAAVVRRHRLLETFLFHALGYTWDEVHADADLLEHRVSEKLLERIDAFLGHPTRDPHGDPIPRADGSVEELSVISLAAVTPGTEVIVEQIRDRDPELLRYLAQHSIIPGARITVPRAPIAGLLQVITHPTHEAGTEERGVDEMGVEVPIATASLEDIRVRIVS